MFEVIEAYFGRQISLNEEAIALIRSVFLPRTIKKGEFFQREGESVKYGAFVSKGFLRSYVIDDKGREHIIQFAPENWWIGAKGPETDNITSSIFIDAIEDSEVLLLDKSGHLKLMDHIPGYTAAFRAGMERRSAAKDKRIVHSLTASAEQRYGDFLATYPTIAQRVPQHMLASYLGITPETLSRIRAKALQKK